MKDKLYAAIDIGTNAGRIMIGKIVIENDHEIVQPIQLVRAPLRLGEDVFETGEISPAKLKKFILTMKSFKLLAAAYDVKNIVSYATSAMREASNRDYVIDKIYKKTKLQIEVIDGDREAELIFKSFNFSEFRDTLPHLFIDVGGGSTELTIFSKNDNKISKSFQIGTIRMLKKKVQEGIWQIIENWLKENTLKADKITAIGTGGNINKISQLARKRYLEPVNLNELKDTYEYLVSMSVEDRIDQLRMNPDRADVIVPATEIYIRIMQMAGIDLIYVPKMGLTDGMILEQYYQYKNK
ncbi:MAG: exopolyphosphatase [Deltaproteobacteria bacterium]